jgi:hypothetical protein
MLYILYSSLLFTACVDKHVDVIFSTNDAFLEEPSICILKIERLESQIIENDRSDKTKGPKQDSQSRLSSPMPEGGKP